MTILIAIVNIAFLGLVAYYAARQPGLYQKLFWPAFILKLSAGLALGLIYRYYYTVGDTFVFFNDGTHLASLARTDFFSWLRFLWSGDESSPVWARLLLTEQRSMFLSKAVSIVNLLTHDNYWISSLYFSAVSFGGAWLLFKTITRFFPAQAIAAAIAFLFFPSVVFWSAGIIKECLAMAALFFLSSVFLRLWFGDRVTVMLGVASLLAIWVLWSLKYYFAAIFIPVVFTSLMVKYIFIPLLKPGRGIVVLWMIVFVIPIFLASLLHPNFYPDRLLRVVVDNYEAFNLISAPEDRIHFYKLAPTRTSLLINTPWALISGLFRPFVWEARNLLQSLIAIENLGVFALVVSTIFRKRSVVKDEHRLLVLAVMVYIVMLCVFLTLSTPNFGTLSRYRTGFQPFVIFLALCGSAVSERMKRLLS